MNMLNLPALLLAGASGGGPFHPVDVPHSVLLDAGSNQKFEKTFASAGTSRRKGTFSAILKLWKPGQQAMVFACKSSGSDGVYMNAADKLAFITGGSNVVTQPALLRDPSQWAHLLCAWDTTQAAEADRVKMWLNGAALVMSGSFPAQNADLSLFHTEAHGIGCQPTQGATLSAYLAEVHGIDGQALTPASFGEFSDTDPDVWVYTGYEGAYGNNGFHLDFANASDLGNDVSGNNHDWTPNGSPTQSVDTPTDNACTLNPLAKAVIADIAFQMGNRKAVSTEATSYATYWGSHAVSSGKWYAEAKIIAGSEAVANFGVGTVEAMQGNTSDANLASIGITYQHNGYTFKLGVNQGAFATYTTNDVVGVALNLDANEVKFYKNNTLQTTISIAAGTYLFGGSIPGIGNHQWAFTDADFTYTPPTGFLALTSANLPDPDVVDPSDNFKTVLWAGNSTDNRSITGVGFQPDFVWIKLRNVTEEHALFDSVRGATKKLESCTTDAEATVSNALTSFDADGFTLGASATVNGTGGNYVGWCFKKTPGFMDIVKWTGDNTSNRNIAHNLGVAPGFALMKSLSTGAWYCWHRGAGGANHFYKIGGSTATTTDTPFGTGNWSATQFMVTNNATNNLNAASTDYIAYLFAHNPGMGVACPYYPSTGNADGPFVHTGFRPAYFTCKGLASAQGWTCLADSARSPTNVITKTIDVSATTTEYTSVTDMDFVSNGVKIRTSRDDVNSLSYPTTYCCLVIGEQSFKYANAR